MRPMAIALILAMLGCGGSKYDEAMKRLVAEEKQLDWIESKIKAIDAKEANEMADIQKSRLELTHNMSELGSDPSEETKKTVLDGMSDLTQRYLQITKTAANDRKPWQQMYADQFKVVTEAQRAVEEAQIKNRPNK